MAARGARATSRDHSQNRRAVAWSLARWFATYESFRQALRQLGYVEGQNVAIELRYAQGGLQQLPDLAAELVRLKVDVIATFGDLAPRIVQQATGTIPIVAVGDDVIGSGLIASLSRPGGNTTGFTILSPELSAKRLELLQEIVPGMSRVAALWDPHDRPIAGDDVGERSSLLETKTADRGSATSGRRC